ncbi:hypothetical protein BJ742DRAFT_207905 [Cladochytrium replicatum]|nr:hypothetical protein BJ742DRAFT_207905 [Cladochytrium replicatum]
MFWRTVGAEQPFLWGRACSRTRSNKRYIIARDKRTGGLPYYSDERPLPDAPVNSASLTPKKCSNPQPRSHHIQTGKKSSTEIAPISTVTLHEECFDGTRVVSNELQSTTEHAIKSESQLPSHRKPKQLSAIQKTAGSRAASGSYDWEHVDTHELSELDRP